MQLIVQGTIYDKIVGNICARGLSTIHALKLISEVPNDRDKLRIRGVDVAHMYTFYI